MKRTRKPTTNLTLDKESKKLCRHIARLEKHRNMTRTLEGMIQREAKRLGIAA